MLGMMSACISDTTCCRVHCSSFSMPDIFPDRSVMFSSSKSSYMLPSIERQCLSHQDGKADMRSALGCWKSSGLDFAIKTSPCCCRW